MSLIAPAGLEWKDAWKTTLIPFTSNFSFRISFNCKEHSNWKAITMHTALVLNAG